MLTLKAGDHSGGRSKETHSDGKSTSSTERKTETKGGTKGDATSLPACDWFWHLLV